MQTLAPGWVLTIWVRNLILITLYAGTLHLWLFTFTLQGDRLKYDARPLMRDNGSFTFRDQVKDNMFWSLTSGVAAWTLFEVLYWWGVANDVIPHLRFPRQRGLVRPLASRRADLHLGALLLRPPPLALAAALRSRPRAASPVDQHRAVVRPVDAPGRKRALRLCGC